MRRFHNQDLVLDVGYSVDRSKWDESKYEAFIEELCGDREYQKDAIRTTLRYLLGGEYRDLRDLATKCFEESEVLMRKYGSIGSMERNLQFPNQLAASLDLATGTGKSYVMYGIAVIMLAEDVVDQVLVLCPSVTIETGLLEKFNHLSGKADLRDLLPDDAKVNVPRIISANESIVSGSICIENYHAILVHVRSSIRDSLQHKGNRTLILNDEAHHVANEAGNKAKKWKEFLTDQDYGFRYIIGVSGTCYFLNEYFSDVIYRYSLQQAMEQNFVKKVVYVAEMPNTRQPEEDKWQLIFNHQERIRRRLKGHNLRPLTIVVTKNISGCKDVAEKFKAFLEDRKNYSRKKIDEQVLVIHSNAVDLPRMASVNDVTSRVEWIFSVSMLNEGWDVKRVFQIVPHEKRAFESKLLIAQVLGRGLRVPDGWTGPSPEVTVFNHDRWVDDIRHLVHEILELENRIPSFPIDSSEFNFKLLNIEYDPKPRIMTYKQDKPYQLFRKGYVDLSTEFPKEEIITEFESADTGDRRQWKTQIMRKTYTTSEVAEVMFQRFEDLSDDEDREFYTKQFPVGKLEKIINESLKRTGNKVITDGIRQKFLQSLGTLQRKETQVVRYDFRPSNYYSISTAELRRESASASDLKNGKTLFYTSETKNHIPDECIEFYEEAIESGSGFKCKEISNHYDFKSPLNAVIADHENELRFVKDLIKEDNADKLSAWVKSASTGFYEIDYFWKKGEHPKRGKFNPDFFIKIGDLILVVEIKGDEETLDPSVESKKKNEYAIAHFEKINAYLKKNKEATRYRFHFLSPKSFNAFFQSIQEEKIEKFRSDLDVALVK